MRRMVLGAVVLLSLAAPARPQGGTLVSLPPHRQALTADLIVVGKVTGIDEAKVEATQYAAPGSPRVEYTVADVRVAESVLGARGLTTVRVGFVAVPPAPVPMPNAPAVAFGQPDPRPVALTLGQESLFCLVKHHTGKFHVVPDLAYPLGTRVDKFDEHLANARHVVKTLRDPEAALKDGDKRARLQSAAALLCKYDTPPPGLDGKPPSAWRHVGGSMVYVPPLGPDGKHLAKVDLPAAESRLLLRALAEMPWDEEVYKGGYLATQDGYFGTLGVSDGRHGFAMPKFPVAELGAPPEQVEAARLESRRLYREAVAGWLKANAETFRVQRYPPK